MVAFEISVNGNPLYTVGAGDTGLLSAKVFWARVQKADKAHEEYRLDATAIRPDKSHARWPVAKVRMGDSITIRIVESEAVDEPSKRPATQL